MVRALDRARHHPDVADGGAEVLGHPDPGSVEGRCAVENGSLEGTFGGPRRSRGCEVDGPALMRACNNASINDFVVVDLHIAIAVSHAFANSLTSTLHTGRLSSSRRTRKFLVRTC